MTSPFAVRLHDDVTVGPVLVRAGRVLRLSTAARELLVDRELVADSSVTTMLAHRLLDLDLAVVVSTVDPPADLSDLTVVIPVRDRPDGVERLLAALDRAAGDGSAGVGAVSCVVVDDASRDAGALRRVVDRHGAQLLRLDRNVGPAAARNAGLARVATRYVAFVDSDVVVTGAALLQLLAQFCDPSVAAVAPRVRTLGGQRWFERYEDGCGSLDLGATPAVVRPWSRVAYVPSACLVARVDALGGGFDASMTSGEDVDLVWRLVAEGNRVRYVAEVSAWHDHRTSVAGWLGRKAFYGTSAAPLARRHGSQVAPAVLSADATALIGTVLVQRWWSWVAAAAVVADSARRTSRSLPELGPVDVARLTASSVASTATQASALALRHWWPLTVALMARSRRARRAVAVAAVVDAVVVRHRSRTELGIGAFVLARRADDLAYGAGVWWGAARARSIRCLLPGWSERTPWRRSAGS